MASINEHFSKLAAGYLFPEISRRVTAYCESNPAADVIRLGIGDVTEPLPPAVVQAMHAAVDDMSRHETFQGYGPYEGFAFLREPIAKHDYQARGIDIGSDEIFISDGSKCDSSNILDIFGSDNVVAITDPVYPVYVDTNVMAGRTGPADDAGRYEGLVYIPVTAQNGFVPAIPDTRVDLIYLCYPNNPTGTVATRETLQQWIRYAQENASVILYDAAYEAYITQPEIPHSIYELDGAREVAIEFRSFSKNAGFTGIRCGMTVVPKQLMGRNAAGENISLHALWTRRQATKFNGASYIVQRGAAAVYSDEGRQQVSELIQFYLTNAQLLRDGIKAVGLDVYGGINAPYVWLKTPDDQTSWDFFDTLLHQAHLVGTPGSGFGASGEGYFRLSAFNSRENIQQAVSRLQKLVG